MSTVVVVDDAGIEALFGPAGPVAEWHADFTERAFARVLDKAPVGQPSKTPEGHPAGWLKSQITWEFVGPLESRITTSAVLSKASQRPGDPYARWIEKPGERPWAPPPFARGDQPYLGPGVFEVLDELGG